LELVSVSAGVVTPHNTLVSKQKTVGFCRRFLALI